jgi:hypothetical protein
VQIGGTLLDEYLEKRIDVSHGAKSAADMLAHHLFLLAARVGFLAADDSAVV